MSHTIDGARKLLRFLTEILTDPSPASMALTERLRAEIARADRGA